MSTDQTRFQGKLQTNVDGERTYSYHLVTLYFNAFVIFFIEQRNKSAAFAEEESVGQIFGENSLPLFVQARLFL